MSNAKFEIMEDEKTLLVTRVINAPKEKVWEAYTNGNLIEQWWGPEGWETSVKKFDFSNGGEWIYAMKCMDKNQGDWYGKESWGKGVYKNINPQDSFEYTDYFCDEKGNVQENMPASHTKMLLEDAGDGKTKLIMQTSYDSAADLSTVMGMGMEAGFDQTLDRLEEFAGKRP